MDFLFNEISDVISYKDKIELTILIHWPEYQFVHLSINSYTFITYIVG